MGARTALAWVGMVSSTWRHAVGNQATTIQDLVKLTRRDIAENVASEQILARLDRVDEMATKIQATPITAPLQVEEGVSSVSIDELLKERVKQLCKRESFKGVQLEFDWGVKESITVRASPDWLRRAFDILLDNAADAMANSTIRKLTIESQLVDNNVKLAITDTGTGVPKQVLPKLFQAPISKPKGSKGLGVGLLMAHSIIQAYGGDIRLGATSSSGTTMIVWLPIER